MQKTGEWKLKRGIDPALVAQIQGAVPATTSIPVASLVPSDLETFSAYAAKICGSGKADYAALGQFIITQGVVGGNVANVPVAELPALAEKLKAQFGVEF